MSLPGSYDIKEFSTNTEGEIRRLNAQVDLFWKQELELYKKKGLIDGIDILDCGSGPGYVAGKIASLYPSIRVTALEIDPTLSAFAWKRLVEDREDDQCTVLNQSILEMDIPDNSFDFIIARLVVEHVDDPITACRELYRVLKPNGVVAIIDNDFEMHTRTFPHISELADLYNAYCTARTEEGGNPKIGRELPCLLKKTGFSEIDLQILSAHSTIIGDEAFLKSEGPGIPAQLVKTGYFSAESHRNLIHKWHSMLRENDHAIVRQLYAATGKKGTLSHQVKASESHKKGIKQLPYQTVYVSKEATIESMLALVSSQVQKILGVSVQLEIDRALSDLGFDSQMDLELQSALSEEMGNDISLSETLVFDHPTIHAIASYILSLKTDSLSNADSIDLYNKSIAQKSGKSSNIDSLSDEEIAKRLSDKLDSYTRN